MDQIAPESPQVGEHKRGPMDVKHLDVFLVVVPDFRWSKSSFNLQRNSDFWGAKKVTQRPPAYHGIVAALLTIYHCRPRQPGAHPHQTPDFNKNVPQLATRVTDLHEDRVTCKWANDE